MTNKHFNKRCQDYLRKQDTMHKIENIIQTVSAVLVVVIILASVVLDFMQIIDLF